MKTPSKNRILLTRIEKEYGTAKKLAEAVGVSAALISLYERNHSQPSLSVFKKIAQTLEVAMEDLIED